MKRAFLLLFVLLGIVGNSFSQSMNDSIFTKKVFGGYQFYQKTDRLKMGELKSIMKPNPDAYQHIKLAQKNNIWSGIIGGVGGFMVGWPLGTALGGGDPNWVLAGVGAGLIVASIPIAGKANREAIKAVDIYNEQFRRTTFLRRMQFHLSMRNNRIGLVAAF